jgi:prohibitin 2
MRARIVVIIAAVIIGIAIIANTFIVVDAGETAVIFNTLTGGLTSVGPGTHILIPGFQKPILYDTRVLTYTMTSTVGEGEARGDEALETLTKDGQVVRIDLSVRFHIDPAKVSELHRKIGPDYVNKVVRPEIRNRVRLEVAAFPVVEVYSERRSEIQTKTLEKLVPRFANNFLVLDEVLVRNIRFSPEFAKAIEQKQIAQQEAQRMQYVLEREKLEKERRIIEAQGEAESIRLRGEILATNPALIQYEYVQKIAPGIQTIITDGKSILSLGELIKK